MEYWTNPIKTYTNTVLPYPLDTDPIVESLHNGEHCLFYQPMLPKGAIYYKQKLQDLCDWANDRTKTFTNDPNNFYDMNLDREDSIILTYYTYKAGRLPKLVESIVKKLCASKIKCYIFPNKFAFMGLSADLIS